VSLKISSGSLGQKHVPLIENITEINSIYIFCRNKQINEKWSNKYQKVKGVLTGIQSLCDVLKQDVRQSESTLTPLSIVSTTSSTNMNELDQSSPIWWYTRECFTYSMLNKALRTQDIEIIIKMGFFIRDLLRQIQQLHSKSNNQQQFVVYRGRGMLNEEFEEKQRVSFIIQQLLINQYCERSISRICSSGSKKF
jgi:hypothetical protein